MVQSGEDAFSTKPVYYRSVIELRNLNGPVPRVLCIFYKRILLLVGSEFGENAGGSNERESTRNPRSKEKEGTRWEIRARRIRKRVRNRTSTNNIRRTKRRQKNNRKEPLDKIYEAPE
jgi:hypothetical protein